MQTVFPMLDVMKLDPKPRERAMIGLSETGIPLRATEDLLEIAASLIDYAKITDHTGLIDRHSREWLRRKIAIYNAHGIDVLPGGIPFQLAAVQGQLDAYFSAVCELGFAAIEISDDVMAPIDQSDREELISKALGLGLKVTTEVGRKNVDGTFDIAAVAEQIRRDLAVGVWKVYLESAEIQAIAEKDPAGLDGLFAAVDTKRVLFELGLIQPLDKAAWLTARYGPYLNFASVSPQDVVPVDAIRRGLHRKTSYPHLAGRQFVRA